MDSPNSLVIDTHHLSKAYKGVQALKDLNLKVQQHSIFGFLGPNGADKTTAIKLLLGLARPTGGSAHVFGHDIQRQSVSIRKRVGYLAQDPRFYEHMTARQTLRFTASFFFSGPKAAIEERIQETLELVGFYSTHILDDVQRVSDTVAILNQGELVAHAPIEELLAGPGGAIYQLKLDSGTDYVRNILQAQPWVKSQGQLLPTVTPIIVTALLAILFIIIALVRFDREEF